MGKGANLRATSPRLWPGLAGLIVVALLATASDASAARIPLRGVVLDALWSGTSDRDMRRELAVSRSAGSNVVRVDVTWSSLETDGKNQLSSWYVRRLDEFMAGARRHGLKVIATLWSTPCWASSAPSSLKDGCAGAWWDRGVTVYPPNNAADYADAARFITRRYGTKLAALEIWNEPNLGYDLFWKASDKAGAYAALVKAAYPAAKAGNRSVPVLAGALVRPDIRFLRTLYADGIKGYYDGISIHPYGIELTRPKLDAFHAAQRRAGDRSPLWVTEFGAPVGNFTGWRVSLTKQAADIKNAFATLRRLRYVRAATLYSLRDTRNDPSDFTATFGVLYHNFSRKPSWAALVAGLRARRASRR
jgi:O-glycosyl hydrolase